MQRNNGDMIFLMSNCCNIRQLVLKARPRQHISNIYIYLYVSDQSGYTGSKDKINLQKNSSNTNIFFGNYNLQLLNMSQDLTKRDLLAIKVKSEIFTEKVRPSCCEQLQKILIDYLNK